MKKPRVLICPLNWGLGHGTRDIPIINWLSNHGFHIFIGTNGRTLKMLRSEFDGADFIDFPDYGVKYYRFLPASLSIVFQIPKIFAGIIREHYALKKIINKYQIDAVISDNRYGLFSNRIPSIFITHQILIKPPRLFTFLEVWLWLFSTYFAQKFSQTWIPDYPGKNNLSGILSHKYPIPDNGTFIGPLVALDDSDPPIKCDILIMVSGPEPARTQFEEIVLKQLSLVPDIDVVLLLGKPEINKNDSMKHISKNHLVYSHLDRKKISQYIRGAELIISRPGYTTVMEAAAFGKKAFWIPTPGQTEQEYLAESYLKQKMNNSCDQNKINISFIWNSRNRIKPMLFPGCDDTLQSIMTEFTSMIKS